LKKMKRKKKDNFYKKNFRTLKKEKEEGKKR